MIADTPGTNAITDKLKHNTEVAVAMNMDMVSRILIVVKADTRMDTVVDNTQRFTDQFVDLDHNMLAVGVTHMDTVTWTKDMLETHMEREVGIKNLIVTDNVTSGCIFHQEIKALCQKKYSLCIDEDNFFKLFKLHSHNLPIIRSCKKQVDLFKAVIKQFYAQRQQYDADSQIDMTFEFQAFMQQRITEAQKEMTAENKFEFIGENATMEAGHIANMSNQLRALLHDIRVETRTFAARELGTQDMRKCYHCGLVWTKVEGCNGVTTCGSVPAQTIEHRSYGVMSSFTFQIIKSKDIQKCLKITQAPKKRVILRPRTTNNNNLPRAAGCGKQIDWSAMKPVAVPVEFREDPKISTDDVDVLPKPAARDVSAKVGQMITSGSQRLLRKRNRKDENDAINVAASFKIVKVASVASARAIKKK